MSCNHLLDNKCLLASSMAQAECHPTAEQCNHCSTEASPTQGINVVTVSIAIKHSPTPKKVIEQYGAVLQEKPHGTLPGTELRKLIAWFVWNKKVESCGECKDREDRMNTWGADRCERNIGTILEWLKESAKENGYPYSERIVKLLVLRAIKNSRRKRVQEVVANTYACIHANHGICQIASKLAGVPAKLDVNVCASCVKQLVPRRVNSATASLACEARKGAGKAADDHLEQMAKGVYRLAGYRLERYIHKWLKRFGVTPPENCGCEAWISKMNAWGIDGSLDHLDEITEHVLENIKSTYLAGLAPERLSKLVVKQRIKACLLNERL